jgi:branched-chain amino acid transport system ATP-binding protein
MSSLLTASGLSVRFGGVRALDGVDLGLDHREILGLIGPNGAGKTTLLNVLSGFQRADRGRVAFADRTITDWDPPRRARAGLGRTFQDVRLFPTMTVLENCELAVVGCGGSRTTARTRVGHALERLALSHIADTPARQLPYGLQRRVGMARALCLRPSVLLLDEPVAGLNDDESAAIAQTMRQIRAEFGCALIVIEHDMRVILSVCDRVHVLDHGVTLRVGSPDEIRSDPEVVRAYLGSEANA